MLNIVKGGLLEHWDGVSLHPYRNWEPESVSSVYRTVRQMILKYKPANKKTVSIVSSPFITFSQVIILKYLNDKYKDYFRVGICWR